VVVPFNTYQSPIKQYISNLDNEMSDVLSKDMPDDKKFVIYNNLLRKYKEKFDPQIYNDQANLTEMITDLKKESEDNYKNLINQVKEEKEELTNLIDVKLEPAVDNSSNKKISKKIIDLNQTKLKKLKSKNQLLSTQNSNIKKENISLKKERPIKSSNNKKRKANDEEIFNNKSTKLDNTQYESFLENDNFINGNTSLMNTARLHQNPLQTRAAAQEYEELYKKSPEYLIKEITSLDNKVKTLNLNAKGLKFPLIKRLKYV
jgi:hypothetical protein